MKRLSTALAAAGLMALAACGSSASNNAAVVNDTVSDTYNVAPDDLTANDLAGNETGNATDANVSADANASGNAQ